jgi:hypothetical protein
VTSTRRAFMQTASAIVASGLFRPTLILRDEIDREAMLRQFCDIDGATRYAMTEPFSIGSLSYATDARWMVRTELASTLDDGVPKRRPPAEDTFNTYWFASRQWRELELPRLEDLVLGSQICPVCHDRRISVADRWQAYCYDSDYDPDDQTIHDRSCHWCWDATSKRAREVFPCLVPFQNHLYSAARLQVIAKIPGVRIAGAHSGLFGYQPGRPTPLQFEGSGFQGLLCDVSHR